MANYQECLDEICDSTQENNVPNSSGHERLVIAVPSDVRSPTGNLPCTDKYPGIYDFGVELSNSNSSRHAWVFSPKLGKVFIDVNKVLLFKFKLNTQNMMGLRVRALLVYIIPDHINNPVNRCTLHAFKCDPNHLAHVREDVCQCNDYNLAGHVITANHVNAEYEYNPESGRHSVVVPLDTPHAGSDSTTVAYQFGCKTSCPGGMSRRPINLVFTLETEHGQVVGRSVLPVKVCSCPKRDKEREESDELPPTDAAAAAAFAAEPRVSGSRRRAHHTDRHSSSKTMRMTNNIQISEQSLAILLNTVQQMSQLLQRIFELQIKQQEETEQKQNEILSAIQDISSLLSRSSHKQK